jgi:hypothetical protein
MNMEEFHFAELFHRVSEFQKAAIAPPLASFGGWLPPFTRLTSRSR